MFFEQKPRTKTGSLLKTSAVGRGDRQPRKPSASSGVAQVEKGGGWLFSQTALADVDGYIFLTYLWDT